MIAPAEAHGEVFNFYGATVGDYTGMLVNSDCEVTGLF